MRPDKASAIKLRRGNKSYNEISRLLKIPKSTLATWFKDDEASKKIRNLLTEQNRKESIGRIKKLVRMNKIKWEQWRQAARDEARKEFPKLAKNYLFVAGLMLYWGEGDSKLKNPLRLTNTSPQMIKIYTKFLIDILKVPKEKLRVGLILYPDLNEGKTKEFWSKTIDMPPEQFYKTQFITGQHPTARLSRGICMIIMNSRQLKEKVLAWIDLISNKL